MTKSLEELKKTAISLYLTQSNDTNPTDSVLNILVRDLSESQIKDETSNSTYFKDQDVVEKINQCKSETELHKYINKKYRSSLSFKDLITGSRNEHQKSLELAKNSVNRDLSPWQRSYHNNNAKQRDAYNAKKLACLTK